MLGAAAQQFQSERPTAHRHLEIEPRVHRCFALGRALPRDATHADHPLAVSRDRGIARTRVDVSARVRCPIVNILRTSTIGAVHHALTVARPVRWRARLRSCTSVEIFAPVRQAAGAAASRCIRPASPT